MEFSKFKSRILCFLVLPSTRSDNHMYKIIDTHAHPQMSQYDVDRDEVVRRALDAGVALICVGVDLESSQAAIDLAEQYDTVWASVGLHPNDNLTEAYYQRAYAELAEHEKVVAIGEVGLDYYRTTEDVSKQTQRNRFEQQLDLAIELEKPLIIHCRDPLRRVEGEASAHQDMIAMLTARHRELPPGVIHSFTGTLEDAEKYLELGLCLGFNGIITFARQYDEVVQNVPLNRILLETDAPYLTPQPYRGKRNEPSYVLEVAKQIGILKNVPDENVMTITTENAHEVFQLTTFIDK